MSLLMATEATCRPGKERGQAGPVVPTPVGENTADFNVTFRSPPNLVTLSVEGWLSGWFYPSRPPLSIYMRWGFVSVVAGVAALPVGSMGITGQGRLLVAHVQWLSARAAPSDASSPRSRTVKKDSPVPELLGRLYPDGTAHTPLKRVLQFTVVLLRKNKKNLEFIKEKIDINDTHNMSLYVYQYTFSAKSTFK